MKALDISYVRSRLNYDPATGSLIWKARPEARFQWWNARYAGAPAGSLDAKGYLRVYLDGTAYKAHRVMWAMVTGA